MRFRGTGIRRVTSSGASPSTDTCQPVSRTFHAGSRSVVQYHVALNRMSGRPPRMPLMVMRCAAPFPASIGARRNRRDVAGHRQLAACFHRVERQPDRIGHQPQRRAETRAQVVGSKLLKRPGGSAVAHQIED